MIIRNDLIYAEQNKGIVTLSKIMVNSDVIFRVTGGPILIIALLSVCVTANDATASTLKYRATPTIGSAGDLSGTSASLASAAAGSTVSLNQTSIATAPDLVAAASGGIQLVASGRTIVPIGTIFVAVGVGSTTGTWKHYLRYSPLIPDSLVTL